MQGIQGHRMCASSDGELGLDLCAYGINPQDGNWYAMTPNGLMANLSAHEVIEHENGTITVLPSILVNHWSGATWHGYLERGVWREV